MTPRALIGLSISALLLAPEAGEGRPGGGQSYRSSRSSSSSSSSGSSYRSSRSSSSSYRSSSSSSSYRSSYRSSSSSSSSSSSGSSYRSSSSSSHRSSSPYRPSYRPPVNAPLVMTAVGTAATRVWRPGGPSPYLAPGPRPAPEDSLCTVSPVGESRLEEYRPSPWTMMLIVVGIIVGFALVARRLSSGSRSRRPPPAPEPVPGPSVARQLERIREEDPDFSLVLLEDFLYSLYAEAHTARGKGELERLAPYLDVAARASLAAIGGRGGVSTIVLGAISFVGFRRIGTRFQIEVELQSNYTERGAIGEQAYYARERWTLVRERTARSRPPERVRVLRCPSCDAPTDKIAGRVCGYCGQEVTTGKHEWLVESITVDERSTRGPMLTGTTEEQGTELPTVVDPELAASLAALRARDPAFTEEGLQARVKLIFETLQGAWSSLEWERARPFLSDRLHEAQSYWIRAYKLAGLRNVTENAAIDRTLVVRAVRDRWYDAITVRLHAHGLDYTVRVSGGEVVGGSKSRSRAYSEYWTLIRSATRQAAARATPDCPQCGAPLAITMAGLCEHCGAKVNSGEFDWVLSRIEQDESYQG